MTWLRKTGLAVGLALVVLGSTGCSYNTFVGQEEGIKAHSEKNGDFYLVTVGRTKSKGKLEKALSRLKELEYDAYIRKLSSPTDET
jgi:hypothetical protein